MTERRRNLHLLGMIGAKQGERFRSFTLFHWGSWACSKVATDATQRVDPASERDKFRAMIPWDPPPEFVPYGTSLTPCLHHFFPPPMLVLGSPHSESGPAVTSTTTASYRQYLAQPPVSNPPSCSGRDFRPNGAPTTDAMDPWKPERPERVLEGIERTLLG